jgi:hypothetical protein
MVRVLRSDERFLRNFAAVDAARHLDDANATLEHIGSLATPDGNAIQRAAAVWRRWRGDLPCHQLRWLPSERAR